MTKYFMLECYGPDEEDRASIFKIAGAEGTNWMLGSKIAQSVQDPIRVDLHPDKPGLIMPMFYRSILLFTDELVEALQEAGVDNLECFDAEVFDPETGVTHSNFKAVNIIGLVSAADLGKSDYQSHGAPIADVDFDSLTLDESKTQGLLMFRLAECVTGIVVHEKVKDHLEKKGIRHLDWIEPESWVG